MTTAHFVVVSQHLRPTPSAEPMQSLPPTLSESPVTAETLLQAWVRDFPDSLAVRALNLFTHTTLLNIFQRILVEKGDVNVDQEDIWGVLADATALQFGMATCSGPNRADEIGPQLWHEATVLGDAAISVQRVLLSVQGSHESRNRKPR